jgi:hypothetical protein
MSTLRPRVVGLLMAMVAAIGAVCLIPGAADAGTSSSVVPGRGRWIAGHTDFVGYYRALVGGRWVKVYCVSPARQVPSSVALHTVSRVPSTTIAKSRQLAEILWAHGNAGTALQAEAVSQALNTVIGNAESTARRASFLPSRVRDLAARYVAEAGRRHGPYRLGLHLPSSPLPGQSAVGSVTLRTPAGALSGRVRLRHTANVRTPVRVMVQATGVGRFRYQTVGGGAAHVAATAHVSPTTLRMSHTDPSTQTLLTWSPAAVVHDYASYQGHGPRIRHRYACTNQCAGRPLVTLTACAPANTFASRITFWIGTAMHRIYFPAAAVTACASWRTAVPDATPVSGTWQYRAPDGWTSPLPAAGAFVVDCPAAPPVAVTISYDCTAATLSATLGTESGGVLTALRNQSRHDMVLVLRGAITDRVTVPRAATAPVRNYPMACGRHAEVTVQGGVERASGGYNFGDPVAVSLP